MSYLLNFFDFNARAGVPDRATAQTIINCRDDIIVASSPWDFAEFFGRQSTVGPVALAVAFYHGTRPYTFPQLGFTGQAAGF
jgi:hypothetical protein